MNNYNVYFLSLIQIFLIFKMNNYNVYFILGNKLPTVYDAAIDIFNICSKPKSEKIKSCIHVYALALMDQWVKAFGQGYIITRQAVEAKLAVIVSNYYNKVYTEQYRTKPKKPGSQFIKKNRRQLNKEWRLSNISYKKNRKSVLMPVDKLLDIGDNMHTLTGLEAAFYADQQGDRVGRISEDVDIKYVEERNSSQQPAC